MLPMFEVAKSELKTSSDTILNDQSKPSKHSPHVANSFVSEYFFLIWFADYSFH
jgi:hypothetical protein